MAKTKDVLLELTSGRYLDKYTLGKILFILNQETDLLEDCPEFEPTWAGPFSSEIYKNIDFLLSCSLLRSGEVPNQGGQFSEYKISELKRYYDDFVLDGTAEQRAMQDHDIAYTATTEGIQLANQYINEEERLQIYKFAYRIKDVGLKALSRYIYLQYPGAVNGDKFLVHFPMG